MNYFSKWFARKKAFRCYKKVLRNTLKSKFGKSSRLTYVQVSSAISEFELEGEFNCYAYAMCLSKKQYKQYQKATGIIWPQETLCIELGVSRKLLEAEFPTVNYYGDGGHSG